MRDNTERLHLRSKPRYYVHLQK